MQLYELIANIPNAHIIQGGNPLVTSISTDSRTVQPGALFIAIRGGQIADRHPFVPQAIAAGAVGVIVEEPVAGKKGIALIQVPSTRHALGILAECFYGSPGQALRVVGVTGTNGKTTTTMLVHAIMDAAGWNPGLIGTLEYRTHNRTVPSHQTTPEAHELQRILRQMVDDGCKAAVMEVSSHALALGRVASIPFDVAVFTNLTRDHLDFHRTFEAYRATKALLFEQLESDALAVVNADDPSTGMLLRDCKARMVQFGQTSHADVRLLSGHTDWSGTCMEVQTPTGKLHLDLALRGHFHLQNVLAAVATGYAMGIRHEIIIDAIREVRIPGRFDAVDRGQDFAIILDFAHTPDGLEKVLKSAREFTKRQLICVFGCDGDRDRGKRPLMGHVAAELADFSIVTTGHPRTEDPEEIIAAILPGIGTAPHQVELDRRKAITMAIRRAMPGDTVVIAGKGRQTYQEIGHEKVSFDEYEVTVSTLDERLMAPGRNTDH